MGNAGKSVLITGGAGFIGSALARRLIAQQASVCVLDNLITGFEHNVPPGVELIRADVVDGDAVGRLFASRKLDLVLHLSAQVSNIVSHADPWLDFRTNVGGTINILEAVRRHRVPRLLYASSMALYGTPSEIPVSESAALQPLSPYAVSKCAAEFLVHNTARRNDLGFGLAVTSLRMFNVYGPGQSLKNPYQGVVGVFISNLLAGKPITLYGDGQQTRDFVYIEDVVDCWLRAIDDPSAATGLRVNVGCGAEHSINHLIDSVLAAFGKDRKSHEVLVRAELPGDQRAIRADVSLARTRLGWQPRTSLADGLAATVEWARRSGAAQ
jgi:UDP-glucose 4-epimerase